MESIQLPHGVWQYDPGQPLGPKGGFGIVYAGFSSKYGDLAIKKIFVDVQDLAHRELRIADELKEEKYQYIIPFYDAGLDRNTGINFVVMARAEKSLQQEINTGKTYSEKETIEILLQIVNGLLEVPELIHRDLKPGNVLFHNGNWKIADFGIAKFVEESTSLQTLKSCLSQYYAAPEQWEYQKPTHAIDVYALGCIGYALLTGKPPFSGSIEELKQQHLHSAPPELNQSNPRLTSLLLMMLRKATETRPSLERIKTLLDQIYIQTEESGSSNFEALSIAAVEILNQSAKKEAQQITEESESKSRNELAKCAQHILWEIVNSLFERITIYAPNASINLGHKPPNVFPFPDSILFLGTASIGINFTRFSIVPKNSFIQSHWEVITGAIIKVQQKEIQPYEWSANLWFTNLGKGPDYRWWEVMYMTNTLVRNRKHDGPISVDDLSLADRAVSPNMDVIQLAAKPKLVDDEAMDNFCDRWAGLLAKAAKGELRRPDRLPLD